MYDTKTYHWQGPKLGKKLMCVALCITNLIRLNENWHTNNEYKMYLSMYQKARNKLIFQQRG